MTYETHLRVVDIVYLVENNKLDIANQVGTLVQHTPQYLCSHLKDFEVSPFCGFRLEKFRPHDQATAFRIDLYIASQDANSRRIKGCLEISEFLIGQCFNR